MIVVGVDPGLHGAIAVYDAAKDKLLRLVDVPSYSTLVSNKVRTKLDVSGLLHEVGFIRLEYAPALVVMEQVGGRPKQSASGGFSFGWVAGAIYTAFIGFRFRVEPVTPPVWKKAMRAPKLDKAIGARADELFPNHKELWRGPRGAVLHDRAEAAMLAKYGAERFGGRNG